jgi:hypothetical protein
LNKSFVEVKFQLDRHITLVHLLSVTNPIQQIFLRDRGRDLGSKEGRRTILRNSLFERIQHPLIPRRLESDFSQVEGVCT